MARTKGRQTKVDSSTTKRTFKNVDAKSTVENEYMEMMKDIPTEAEATPMITVSDTDNDKITEIQDSETEAKEPVHDTDNIIGKELQEEPNTDTVVNDTDNGSECSEKAPHDDDKKKSKEQPNDVPNKATSESKVTDDKPDKGENNKQSVQSKKRRLTNKEAYGYDWLGVNYDI